MKKILVILITIYALGISNISFGQNFSDQSSFLKTVNYNLNVKVDFQEKKLYSVCKLTLLNPTNEKIQTIPLLLYRLLNVSSVKDENGKLLPFRQRIKVFEDWDVLQVNFVEIKLDKAVSKNETKKIIIEYSGHLLGYSETGMNYIKDKIDPDFTIIRPDCISYPIIGKPVFSTLRSVAQQNFNYDIKITIPDSLFVVNGGALLSKKTNNGLTEFHYKSVTPTTRIDITISKYKTIQNKGIKTFYFEKDSTEAKKIENVMIATFDLYSKWWGALKEIKTFSLIEIPKGYGSQANQNYILQTAAAFNDLGQLEQLYHEISHLWNVNSLDENYSRWNEGLATFMQYLTIEKLENRDVLDNAAELVLKRLKNKITTDPLFANTPMVDYGKKNMTDYSYSVGMIMFHLLYKITGERQFNTIIGSFYQKYHKSGATTNDFVKNANSVTSIDLTKFFNDWLYSTNYTEYIKNGMPINEMVNIYKTKQENTLHNNRYK